MPLDGSANPIIPVDASYNGYVYAYEASGGYVMEQGIPTIKLNPYETINKYDVTQAFQIKYDVREFNEKLQLYKDASNVGILDSSFNPNTLSFPNNSVSLSAPEFRLGVSESNILSVGQYHTLYKNFETFLNYYFGFPEGFTSLFSLQSQVDINGGLFDASAMINLMNYSALNTSGEYVNTMTGTITINHVNALLRFACLQNPFNNRTNQTPADGFMERDLIYVPTGTQVTLVAHFENVPSFTDVVAPTNEYLAQIEANSAGFLTGDFQSGDYSQITTFDSTSVTRTVKVPLLIKLANLSTRELYMPYTQIQANFDITIGGITMPITDPPTETLSEFDLDVLRHSFALAIGINTEDLTIASSSISSSSRNLTLSSSETSKYPEFNITRELVLNKLRTNGTVAIIRFNVSTTLDQINQSPNTLQKYTTAGQFINSLTNVLTYAASQQSLVQMITTASLSDPSSSLMEITSLSGTMAEVNVIEN
jgi:hypothetical protein